MRRFLLAGLMLLAIWQGLSWLVRSPVLPDPPTVGRVFVQALGGRLGEHMLVSAYRVVGAMVLAGLVGSLLGLVIGHHPRWNALAAPAIYLTYPIPKIVFLPLVMLFLGVGDAAKIFLIALILFFQVLVVVRDAAASVRFELVLSVRSLGATRWQLLRYIYLPACLPAVLTGLRVSTGTAIAVLFLTESFATQAGLGYYILVETWGRMAYPEMYAGVLAMSLLGMGLYLVLDRLERRLCGWLTAGGGP